MSMFGLKFGTWWIHSDEDPRWNKEGRGYGLVSSGGPDELFDWLDECKQKFGKQPDDLTVGFMKD